MAQEPARRRIASEGVRRICRHLGRNLGQQPGPVINNEGENKLSPDSIHKDRYLKQPRPIPAEDSDQDVENCLPSASSRCSLVANSQTRGSAGTDQLSEESSIKDDECIRMLEEYSLPTSFGKPSTSWPRSSTSAQNGLKRGVRDGNEALKGNKSCIAIEPFDICLPENEEFLVRHSDTEDHMFVSSSVDMEVESVPEEDQLTERSRQRVLRPGMVLLKNYITHSEQVFIVNKCRELGLRPGGFYRPGYKDGPKLRLHMMCLGRDWDPQTRKYQKRRRIDRSIPPHIPYGFHQLVDRAMKDSYTLIRRDFEICNAEEILPSMSPDICIVNFYTESGRLGLHQDRDESADSLTKGLPVVSFSVGDSAEFLYGDQRDVNEAEKLVLESGDVLIFGGKSRHVFHGVASIIPNSAPRMLLEETLLRPGRLNLTFRQF